MYLPQNSLEELNFNNSISSYSEFLLESTLLCERYGEYLTTLEMLKAAERLASEADSTSISEKAKNLAGKMKAGLQKLIDYLINFSKNMVQKFAVLHSKIGEQLQKAGVEGALNTMKSNINLYKYDEDYYNGTVAETDFTNPLTKEIIDVFLKGVNECNTSLNTIKNKSGSDAVSVDTKALDTFMETNLKAAIEKMQVKGKTFQTSYFSNNLKSSLPLVQGLFASVNDAKRAEAVSKPFTTAVTKFGTDASALSKKFTTMQNSANNANNKGNLAVGYQAINKLLGYTTKLSNMFQSEMIKINISRLKIINTFLKLWIANTNADNSNPEDAKKKGKAKPKEEKVDVSQAGAAA